MGAVLLVAEMRDLAADLLVVALGRRGAPFVRLNLDHPPGEVGVEWRPEASGRALTIGTRSWPAGDISAAWYRRSPPAAPSGEPRPDEFASLQVAELFAGFWETSSWLWVNHPAAVRRSEVKMLQLTAAAAVGLCIPETLVTNRADPARAFVQARDKCVAKPLRGNRFRRGESSLAVFTSEVKTVDIDEDAGLGAWPCIFQERLPHHADVRVTVVGDQVFAAAIRIRDASQAEVDWRTVDPSRLSYDVVDLPESVAAASRKLLFSLGLAYGALDFILGPDGGYTFLEVNPSGQWGWIEQATGLPITESITTVLTSCA